jgi:O-antigen/teichoic acid export membrane protein
MMVDRREELPRIVASAITARALAAPVFFGAMAVYVHVRHFGGQESLVFYIVGAAGLTVLLTEPILAAFQAVERMGYVAAANVVMTAGTGLAGIALVLAGFRLVALAITGLAISVFALLLASYWGRRAALVGMRTDRARVRELARGSLPFWSTTIAFTFYLMIDSVILSIMEPSAVVGWYGVATRLFGTFLFVPSIIGTAWYPRLVTAFKEDGSRFADTARPYVEILAVISIPLCAAIAIGAKQAVQLLYGPAYAHAVPVLVVLAFCVPLTYLGTALYQVLCAVNRPIVMTKYLIVTCGLNVALNIVFIPMFGRVAGNGAMGSAVSLLVTEVFMTSCLFVAIGRRVANRGFWTRILRTTTAALLAGGARLVSSPLGSTPSFSLTALAFVAGALALGVPTASERAALKAVLRRQGPWKKPPGSHWAQ